MPAESTRIFSAAVEAMADWSRCLIGHAALCKQVDEICCSIWLDHDNDDDGFLNV